MTKFSGANDSSDLDGITILLECEDNEYVFISGCENNRFETDDKVIDYISLMGNNMCPSTIAVGEKNTYFISDLYKFIENEKIDEGTFLNATNDNLNPFLHHLGKCGADSFKTIEHSEIHSFYLDSEEEGEDEVEDGGDVLVEEAEGMIETNSSNGSKNVVKIFNQKCVICYERDRVDAFRQCGQQNLCDECYQNEGGIDILNCVVFRT